MANKFNPSSNLMYIQSATENGCHLYFLSLFNVCNVNISIESLSFSDNKSFNY